MRALLATDLADMNEGRSGAGGSALRSLSREYPAGSAQLRRIRSVHDSLLTTAASDLFGRFARDTASELAAYGPRIAAGCG